MTFGRPRSSTLRLSQGPGTWSPGREYLGPANCSSASPCGGEGAVFAATRVGDVHVLASAPTDGGTKDVFDLHVVVGPPGTSPVLDLRARQIADEAEGTGVTMPVGSTVRLHLRGSWGPPRPSGLNDSLRKDQVVTSGVISAPDIGRAGDEATYRYTITGPGSYVITFEDLDPQAPAGAGGFTVGFATPT